MTSIGTWATAGPVICPDKNVILSEAKNLIINKIWHNSRITGS